MGTKLNPGKFDCYENAEPDEPMFVLLARDPAAPHLTTEWTRVRPKLGKHDAPEKIQEALDCAEAMRRWYQAKHAVPAPVAPAPRGEEGFKELWQKLLDKPDDEPITYEEAESFYLAGLAAAPKAPGHVAEGQDTD